MLDSTQRNSLSKALSSRLGGSPWHLLGIALLATLGLAACSSGCATSGTSSEAKDPQDQAAQAVEISDKKGLAVATLAGGCFWCMEKPFEKVPGVHAVISGYSGGQEVNPTYRQVGSGRTGHTEAVQISYDPEIVSFDYLLKVYWRQVNPTDSGGQFVDRGSQYRPEIFYHSEAQKIAAEKSKAALSESGRFSKAIMVPITKYLSFYAAEDYHQDFYKKSPDHYQRYRRGSGRDRYLDEVWGKDRHLEPPKPAVKAQKSKKSSAEELKKRLTTLQYRVTQQDGTEPPFRNKYWNNKEEGIYVDIVSGEPLFSSIDKFKSGTGWPSFTKPLDDKHIKKNTDYKLGYGRTEVRSASADSHLGHVFDDGPAPTGLRYCINSASLRFVPKAQLEKEGLGEYLALFR